MNSDPSTFETGVLTISDSCSRQERKDLSGQLIIKMLETINAKVTLYDIVPDDFSMIQEKLIDYCDHKNVSLVLTTGGTGFSPRDVTPEATQAIAERNIPGFSELMRWEGIQKTKKAALSRGVSVIRGNSIIINLPGSPSGVRESLTPLLDLIPHSLKMLKGQGH